MGSVVSSRNYTAISLVSVLALVGCENSYQTPLRLGVQNWKPQSVSGPIEVRALPPAQRVMQDYEQWSNSQTVTKARVYSKTLRGPHQVDFRVQYVRGDTPAGAADNTFVLFTYKDPTDGQYQFEWEMVGRHNADFLKLDARTAEVWLEPFGMSDDGKMPRLQIVAVEGLEPLNVLVALPGKRPLETE